MYSGRKGLIKILPQINTPVRRPAASMQEEEEQKKKIVIRSIGNPEHQFILFLRILSDDVAASWLFLRKLYGAIYSLITAPVSDREL